MRTRTETGLERTSGGRWVDGAALALATAFVGWHLRPDLLLTPTITTGGDTASHYLAAAWLRDHLLPELRLTGWVPGQYAGFPLFQIYFPLPFLAMAILSFVTGLPIAFKLVTVAGLVGLPAAAFLLFRLLRLPAPAPGLAAVFAVAFLFHEANSMWGANVASTLAGEFTYAIGTALLLVAGGTLYRGARSGRGWTGNAVLLAAIGLCHAYTLLAAASFGAYLVLVHPDGRRALPYLLKVAGLAAALMAFWLVPLLVYAPYTTAYSVVWPIDGVSRVLPAVWWPLLAAGALGATVVLVRRVRAWRAGASTPIDHRIGYLLALPAGSVVLYLAAWKLDVVDMRFLPFAQVTIVVMTALPVASGLRWLARSVRSAAVPAAATVGLAVATLGWVESRIGFIDDWVAWNYAGFEATPGWAAYRAVNDAVARSSADPRVVYEHTAVHDEAGTVRAFESLPLFAGASTLEGPYMQSTISSPFVFYVQSEISQIPSCPLLPYHCGRLDPDRAAEHLRLFNVSDVIVRGETVREAFERSASFTRRVDVPPYTVFTLNDHSGRYVEPLRHAPLVFAGEDWREAFFAWFKRPGSSDVTLLRAPGDGGAAPVAPGWTVIDALPDDIPRQPLDEAIRVTETMSPEEIRIHTSQPGHPLLVKVSYHPRWQVEGAARVWQASPSFMVVVPEAEDVRLVYRASGVDRLAGLVTAVGIAWTIWRLRPRRSRPERAPSRWLDRVFAWRRVWSPVTVVAVLAVAVGIRLAWVDPWVPHRAGLARFHDGDYAAAESLLAEAVAAAPMSAAAYYSDYYLALSAHRADRWPTALERFERFVRLYPDGELVPEALFRIAEAHQHLGDVDRAVAAFVAILDAYPETRWAGFAAERLTVVEVPSNGT